MGQTKKKLIHNFRKNKITFVSYAHRRDTLILYILPISLLWLNKTKTKILVQINLTNFIEVIIQSDKLKIDVFYEVSTDKLKR